MIKLVDQLSPMGNFAVATATDIVCSDNERLQDKIDNGTLGGDNSQTLTEAEFLALPEEQKLNNSYYLYDIGVHYKNGVAYSRKKPIQLTMEEYKALGEVDPDQEYIISADEQGILLGAEDIGYNNAESGIQATTVQGAIDKIAETSGNVYSTEETICGTWIDGKPIYRKVIEIDRLNNNTETSINHNIDNLDFIISYKGIATYSSGYKVSFPSLALAGSDHMGLSIYNETIIKFTVGTFGSSLSNIKLSLEYTKTTDA